MKIIIYLVIMYLLVISDVPMLQALAAIVLFGGVFLSIITDETGETGKYFVGGIAASKALREYKDQKAKQDSVNRELVSKLGNIEKKLK